MLGIGWSLGQGPQTPGCSIQLRGPVMATVFMMGGERLGMENTGKIPGLGCDVFRLESSCVLPVHQPPKNGAP